MPKSAGLFNDEEFFEIQEFIQKQNQKIARLQHRAWVNRNKTKLNKYWKRWYNRPLTKVEMHTFAAGTDDPLSREREYKKLIKDYRSKAKSFRRKKDWKNYRKYRGMLKRTDKRRQAYMKRKGKNLEQLMAEYEEIKTNEAIRQGFLQGSGFDIRSAY